MIFVVGGSGGLSTKGAILHIIALVNSTITLSKNNTIGKILTANMGHVNANNSKLADWYYSINSNNYGEWSIKVEKDQDSTTKVISISDNKQYDIRFDNILWIVKDGYLQGHSVTTDTDKFTPTENYNNTSSLRLFSPSGASAAGQHYAFFKPAYDFTTRSYNFLNCDFMADNMNTSNTNQLGIGSDEASLSQVDWPISQSFSTKDVRTTAKIDISELTGSLFVKIVGASSNSYDLTLYLYNIWLSDE